MGAGNDADDARVTPATIEGILLQRGGSPGSASQRKEEDEAILSRRATKTNVTRPLSAAAAASELLHGKFYGSLTSFCSNANK